MDALFDCLVIDDMDCSVKRKLHFLYWANTIWNTVRFSRGHPLKEREQLDCSKVQESVTEHIRECEVP